jgi:hypothetical protein
MIDRTETPAARERREKKQRYQAYREQAREMVDANNPSCESTVRNGHLTIPEHATVHEVGDGAFVEAIIWVPRASLKEDE